jgi:cytochrome c oxidase subunit 2
MVVLILAGSAGGLVAANVINEPTHRHFIINARMFAYTPEVIKVNKGDIVTIDIISHDATHGFYLDGYEINLIARPAGDGATVTFVADKTGKFWFRCSVTCGVFHPFMIGEFIVEPNRIFPGSVGMAIGLAAATVFYVAWRKPQQLSLDTHSSDSDGKGE